MTEPLNIPNKVIDSDWKDDVAFEPYQDEKTYISPKSVKKYTITKIKKSKIKLAINNMVDWDKVFKQAAA